MSAGPRPMDVVFMGTPGFAVPVLRALAGAHRVLAVYTRPDAASGRGSRLLPPPVKSVALELGLPVRQPATLRDPQVRAELAALRPDVVCVAAYGAILPPEVLAIPRHGCLNVHASLLPRWRGAAPIQRAILAGDATAGASIMRMEAGLDTGPWALQTRTPVGDATAAELTARLAELGASALLEVLSRLDDVVWVTQDDADATYASKVTRADVALSPDLPAEDALRRVRASGASAPARLVVADRVLTVVAASRATAPVRAGVVLATPQALLIGMADAALSLDVVRPAGRGDMPGAAWARGARLSADAIWQPA